jgi:hypothetical protein
LIDDASIPNISKLLLASDLQSARSVSVVRRQAGS